MYFKRSIAVLSTLTFMGMLMTGCNTASLSSVVDETEMQTEIKVQSIDMVVSKEGSEKS